MELIAADVRACGDGKGDAWVRSVAGLLGVGFDALRQRVMQRRQENRARWMFQMLEDVETCPGPADQGETLDAAPTTVMADARRSIRAIGGTGRTRRRRNGSRRSARFIGRVCAPPRQHPGIFKPRLRARRDARARRRTPGCPIRRPAPRWCWVGPTRAARCRRGWPSSAISRWSHRPAIPAPRLCPLKAIVNSKRETHRGLAKALDHRHAPRRYRARDRDAALLGGYPSPLPWRGGRGRFTSPPGRCRLSRAPSSRGRGVF